MLPQQRYLNNLRRAANRPRPDPHWANVVLLCDFNGTDGSTSFVDLSNSAHSLSAAGTAQLDTAQKQYGASSLLATGGYATASANDDWYLTNTFTIEAAIRLSALPAGSIYGICDQWDGLDGSWYLALIQLGAGVYALRYQDRGAGITRTYDFTIPLDVDTWMQIALVSTGGQIYAFRDGDITDQETRQQSQVNSAAAPFKIGVATSGTYLGGWVDNLRITKGVARYTSNYTPLNREYPTR